ncbi:DNA repair protein rad52 [Apophysomyces sp. BC1034]|nr:DNA repair protein rad52 [Apophysomyces sp. BC1015]KAG0177993.1 DNA repair protein rad52 [Apophysomyces sp. BC1021]KAG0188232.1 DNA repair protein rad52 [Apophysomyces sp. BC1034]
MSSFRPIAYDLQERNKIKNKLVKNLGHEWLSQRVGGGGRLTYIEGKTAINLANEIFGFNGWSTEVRSTTVDFVDVNEQGRVSVGISTVIRVTVKDGTFHEDIGYGSAENSRSKATAFEKAKKESATDGMKRALRMFGNALGNCIYDKGYIANVSRTAKQEIKFHVQDLYRHKQFRTSASSIHNSPQQKQLPVTTTATNATATSSVGKTETIPEKNTTPATATTTTSPPAAAVIPPLPQDASFTYDVDEVDDEVFASLVEQEFDKPDLEYLGFDA